MGLATDVLNRPEIIATVLKDDGAVPNNRLPLLVYRTAVNLEGRDPAALFEELFQSNDWTGTWRNGIYTYHHYHSTTHEVLGVFKGSATIQFGGEKGIKQKITAGDVVIIPAGVAHKNLGASSDFAVVGGYPGGAEWDMNYGRPNERPASDENIAQVAMPKNDPLHGASGPLFQHWTVR
ncbi:MAG TPA: cupin domain-containing protein [Verrucomicrobiae bacterium]|nr:cupin domain-containing protein [Verrucomicrobiae bacterium]